jgi:hypothetical protein
LKIHQKKPGLAVWHGTGLFFRVQDSLSSLEHERSHGYCAMKNKKALFTGIRPKTAGGRGWDPPDGIPLMSVTGGRK